MSRIISSEDKGNFQDLSIGQSGTMVYIAQKIFNSIGYELKEDGVFSKEMENVVKEFQERREHLLVDGIVGYQTMKEMDETSNTI